MSLETSIERLALAVERNYEALAVAEIIRQRDEALEIARRDRNGWEWADKRRDEYASRLEKERRRVRSLRGVITRMKKKGK